MTDPSLFMTQYMWDMLQQTQKCMKHYIYDGQFSSLESIESAMASTVWTWAPNLMRTIQAPGPPSIHFFKSLIMPNDANGWAVYALVLEKDGSTPLLYVRSGTAAVQGVKRRMRDYNVRPGQPWPENVSSSVARKIMDGYKITSKGYFCWIQIPKASDIYMMRALFVGLLETSFSLIFWSMKTRKDGGMPEICPWDRKDFSYGGLCSHFAINEPIQGEPAFGDPDQINALAEEHRKAKQSMYIANRGEGVHAANTKAYGEKNLAVRRFACETCDFSARTEAKLKDHLASKEHKDRVAGRPKYTSTRACIVNKKWWCEPCQHNAPSAARWAKHLTGKYHAKKLRDIAIKKSLGRA